MRNISSAQNTLLKMAFVFCAVILLLAVMIGICTGLGCAMIAIV